MRRSEFEADTRVAIVVHSEARLIDRLESDLLGRWFLGTDPAEDTFDATGFTHDRPRPKAFGIVRPVSDGVFRQAMHEGGGRRRAHPRRRLVDPFLPFASIRACSTATAQLMSAVRRIPGKASRRPTRRASNRTVHIRCGRGVP
jgi:hypothetical protein